MNVILRPITTKDDILKLMSIEGLPEYKTFIRQWSLEEHLKCLNDPDYTYFLVFDSTQLVGYVFFRGLKTQPLKIEVKRIALHPPDKGYGTEVFHKILSWSFDEKKATTLWLDHFEDNYRAHALYEKFGFQEIRRESVIKPDGTPIELIIMELPETRYRKV